jgi:hypothetical protein
MTNDNIKLTFIFSKHTPIEAQFLSIILRLNSHFQNDITKEIRIKSMQLATSITESKPA